MPCWKSVLQHLPVDDMSAVRPTIRDLDAPAGLRELDCALAEIHYPVNADIMWAEAEALASPAPQPHWHEGRIADYVAGRLLAEQLLPENGERAVSIGPSGAPVWPSGWTGSISHSRLGDVGRAVAIVAPENRCRSLGIDTQFHPKGPLKQALLQRVCLPGEWDDCGSIASDAARFALIFSAKESAYKALHGLLPASSGITLGYHSVRLDRIAMRSGIVESMEMLVAPEVCEACGVASRHVLHAWPGEERVCSLMTISL